MRSGRLEAWRRAFLVAGAVAAVVAATWVDLGPLVEVEGFDAQTARRRLLAGAWVSQEERALASLPDDELVAVTVRGQLERSADPAWSDVARHVAFGLDPQFLRLDQPPVADLRDRLPAEGAIRYVEVGDGEHGPAILRLTRRDVTLDDFQLGTGWVGGRRPPTRLLFPWRPLAPWLAAGALLGYVLPPWRRRAANQARYARARLVPGDLLGLVLLVGLGGLPILIVGGALQAALATWPLLLFFWPVAMIGGLLLYYCGWWAAFSVQVEESALVFETARRRRAIPHAALAARRPAVLRLPRWFRALQWLAVLVAPAARRPMAAGSALVTGGVLSTGTALVLRDGSMLYLWGTTPSGGSMLDGAPLLEEALADVPAEDEPLEVRSLRMPLHGRPSPPTA